MSYIQYIQVLLDHGKHGFNKELQFLREKNYNTTKHVLK